MRPYVLFVCHSREDPYSGTLRVRLASEAMQFVVVAATLPSRLILSCTVPEISCELAAWPSRYLLRWAALSSRSLNIENVIDPTVENVARHAPSIAVALFMLSLFCWLLPSSSAEPNPSA